MSIPTRVSFLVLPSGGPFIVYVVRDVASEQRQERNLKKDRGHFTDLVRHFTGGSRPQGHLPRLISDGFGSFLLDDPGSEEYSFMCHSFMCLFDALALSTVCNASPSQDTAQARGTRERMDVDLWVKDLTQG